MIVIVMGVTGTGKSTVGAALARRTGWRFAEGDEYHSAANVAKLRSGSPLTDQDREPWLNALHAVLLGWQSAGESGVMTCSALKQSYRKTLSAGFDPEGLRFVLLQVPKEVLAARLAHRPGHFMNPALLDSQLATLELPADAIAVDGDQPIENIVRAILEQLRVTSDR